MEKYNLSIRGNIIIVLIGVVMASFILRLYFIQVASSVYEGQAERYVRKEKTITAPRGNIYNRYGQIYVSNSPMFDLMVTPRELSIPDTAALCKYLDIEPRELGQLLRKFTEYSAFKESILARYIEPETYGPLQESIWNVTGVSFNVTNKRFYNYPVGANFLGYISEVNAKDITRSEGYYHMGDLKGKSGIEKSYEDSLHGDKGRQIILKDVHNREVGSYADGELDIEAKKGIDLMLGIDTDLQAFGEELMKNKKGSIVAIEPSTGEILAFVSAPSYSPNELTGRELQRNWRRLEQDTLNPLFNRPLQAKYPPGSIFKVAVALAALNEGVIYPNTFYRCGGGFMRNRGKPGCRFHPHPLDLANGIKYSCNSYFAATYMDFLNDKKFGDIYTAFKKWSGYMQELGMGAPLQVDIPYEEGGLLPTTGMYDRAYGENRWGATNIISNAIGQGEILMTPLQMANLAAVIANRGYFFRPHFVKARQVGITKDWQKSGHPKRTTSIKKEHFNVVADAMEQVVATGTARRAIIEGVSVCGKTGTVENPHGDDHATFIGFAPKDKPRIAIAVIIENSGGGGGRWAAPTASLMMEKYLSKKIEKKKFELERIKSADFIHN